MTAKHNPWYSVGRWLLPLIAVGFPPISQAQTCDQTLWQHVYNAHRLAVQNACVSVTGTIVDASHGRNKDGARHEADGDSHNWLKLDPGQALPNGQGLLLPGNTETQDGNLVFEIICRYRVTQADAKAACVNFRNAVVLPPVGSHVRITGALIDDLDHKPIHREIHPVTRIEVIPDFFPPDGPPVIPAVIFSAAARQAIYCYDGKVWWHELGTTCHANPAFRVLP